MATSWFQRSSPSLNTSSAPIFSNRWKVTSSSYLRISFHRSSSRSALTWHQSVYRMKSSMSFVNLFICTRWSRATLETMCFRIALIIIAKPKNREFCWLITLSFVFTKSMITSCRRDGAVKSCRGSSRIKSWYRVHRRRKDSTSFSMIRCKRSSTSTRSSSSNSRLRFKEASIHRQIAPRQEASQGIEEDRTISLDTTKTKSNFIKAKRISSISISSKDPTSTTPRWARFRERWITPMESLMEVVETLPNTSKRTKMARTSTNKRITISINWKTTLKTHHLFSTNSEVTTSSTPNSAEASNKSVAATATTAEISIKTTNITKTKKL